MFWLMLKYGLFNLCCFGVFFLRGVKNSLKQACLPSNLYNKEYFKIYVFLKVYFYKVNILKMCK